MSTMDDLYAPRSQTLPDRGSSGVQSMAEQNSNFLTAYDVCLREEALEEAKLEEAKSEKLNSLCYIRVLGYLLIHAATRGMREEVARAIHSCRDHQEYVDLGKFYAENFIKRFYKFHGRRGTPSEHPSRPSFDYDKATMEALIMNAPKDHAEAKKQALIRDSYRCVVTQCVQWGAPDSPFDGSVFFIESQCAHIIPESLYFDVDKAGPKRENSSSLLAILDRFRYDTTNLLGEHVHALQNVMTMEMNVHDAFDRLAFYFEATNVPHQYKTRTFRGLPHPTTRPVVKFETQDPEHLPLPDPRLLALHATCSKVAHFSGAAEHFDRLRRDLEDVKVLADDGTSANLLQHTLSMMVESQA